MIGEHLQEFGGLPAFDFPAAGPDGVPPRAPLPEADTVAWRIAENGWDDDRSWEDTFARFLDTVDTASVRALIVGMWPQAYDSSADGPISALVSARDRLPALRAIFLGDITFEECEISWINQGHVSRLLDAFPRLDEFGIRGGTELEFDPVRHERLRTLTVQAGGLPADAVRGIASSALPGLASLELWLGTAAYGGDVDTRDLAPLCAGELLPSLRHLALRNSEIQDLICAELATAPVVARLHALDLSMGVLTDEGAEALLTGQPLTHLHTLDLHHNFLSEEMRTRLRDALAPAGVLLDLDPGDARQRILGSEVRRFVSVAE